MDKKNKRKWMRILLWVIIGIFFIVVFAISYNMTFNGHQNPVPFVRPELIESVQLPQKSVLIDKRIGVFGGI